MMWWLSGWVYSGFILTSAVFLALNSVFKFSDKTTASGVLLLAGVVCIWWWRRFKGSFEVKRSDSGKLILVPMLLVLVLRGVLLFPNFDDMAFHTIAGDYALTMWKSANFMPMDLVTYMYPLFQIVYLPFLSILGIRLTVLLNSLLLILWYVSLNLRFKSLFRDKKKGRWLDLLWLYLFFIPHLMAAQITLMMDFLVLVLGLEVLCQMLSKSGNRTLGIILSMFMILGRQSSGILLVPVVAYWLWRWREKIDWKVVSVMVLLPLVFFVKCWAHTGNPISFLYNGIFQSPLYFSFNFRDMRWGPENFWQGIIWPFWGQFTQRFGEGFVDKVSMIWYSPLIGMAVIISLFKTFKKRSGYWLMLFLGMVLWVVSWGYSRYHIPVTSVILVSFWLEGQWKVGWVRCKRYYILLLLITILSLRSLRTDFGWRPLPLVSIFNKAANLWQWDYYKGMWREGLSFTGEDRLQEMAKDLETDFKGYQTVILKGRGIITFYGYLGYLNGLRVVNGMSVDEAKLVTESDRIEELKVNASINDNKILVVTDSGQENTLSSLVINADYDCKKKRPAGNIKYFQSNSYFSSLSLFECREKVSNVLLLE